MTRVIIVEPDNETDLTAFFETLAPERRAVSHAAAPVRRELTEDERLRRNAKARERYRKRTAQRRATAEQTA